VRALEQALVADPQPAEARRLYLAVMDELGRGDEAGRFLADLPRLAAEAARAPPPEGPPAAPGAPPPAPVAPAAHRTGELTVHGVERSPLSAAEQIAAHFGIARDAIRDEHPRALEYRIEDESFDLYVPESYRAGEAWGVLVWVSPGDRGGLRSPAVRDLLATRRLLWIGANASSNRRARFDRAGLALDALHLARTFYDIDPERVFVAGYSGGGRMASQLAFLFPEVFRGAVCWFGVDHFRPLPVPYRPGYHFPPGFPVPSDERLSTVRRHSRFALVTGQRDFNRSETRAVHAAWLQERIRGTAYFEIPDADHYHGLDAGWLARALDHVDPD
jgi:predicted esterase